MISKVSLTKTEFSALPNKFEAGTPHIAGAIGLNVALKFRQQFASKDILEHERVLWTMAYSELKRNKQITIVGPEEVKNRTGILAFYHHKIHAHDLGQIMAEGGVCVRAGHHCAMPLHESYKVPATVRASFYIYNNQADVTKFLKALERAEKLLL
jgi:cysteine desulfurase/selenocysteine lyase